MSEETDRLLLPSTKEAIKITHDTAETLRQLRATNAALLAALGKMAREHVHGCVACWTRIQIAQDVIDGAQAKGEKP